MSVSTVFTRDHTAADLHGRFAGLAPDEESGASVRVAGRIMLVRRHGGVIFFSLRDQTGSVQLLVSRSSSAFGVGESLGRGDWIGACGEVITTHTGELTVAVGELELLTKAVRALPEKHRGPSDPETRQRERYVDLIGNPEVRRTFDIRSAVISSVRATLAARGFTEVETPVLEANAGGATARPFVTHHNALDTDMYLRIALELHLKRLVVGGYERVYEMGRVFRNEGVDASHNPEFTLLEAYQALADYRDMMELVETIVSEAALAANGTTVIEGGIDLAPPWRRATMAELVLEHAGVVMHPSMPVEEARAICARLEIAYEMTWGSGRLMAEVFEATAESSLVTPTFVLDHPREISPLAKSHADDPSLTERFEAYVGGRELANAYSELNDPVDQHERFVAEGGPVDEDYVRALEYGMPPTGGLGIGIDRLVMLIAGVPSIRDVVLFPALRPRLEPVSEVVPEVIEPVRRPWAPRVLGALTGLTGLGLLFEHWVRDVGHVPTVIAGFILILLAGGLRRGKQAAWGAAVALLGGAALLRIGDPVVVLPAVTMFVALIWKRDSFTARPDPGSLRAVLLFMPLWAAAVTALEVMGDRRAGLAVLITGLVVVAWLAFRAVRAGVGASEADRARALELVRAHGTDTLDYFALRPDKRYFFCAGGDGMVAYKLVAGHALVAGDYIGSPRVVGEFLSYARSHGWRVAFLGAREADAALYERCGMHSIYLGDEAVLRCDDFRVTNKSVRSAVSRVGRDCSFTVMREVDASAELRDALNALRDRWRDGAAERGFTMELGGGVRGVDPELLLAVAFARDSGRPLGFLRLTPCFGEEAGWSLDLMNHDPDAPNGMTEYLIAMTARELAARGYHRMSLNFATWGRLFAPDARLTLAQRGQRRLGLWLSPYFQITSLRDFNAKFDPEWVPRSIIVEDLGDAPRVGLLYAAVEGFLPGV